MEPTIDNRDFMFNGPPSLVKPFITKVFARLRDPNVPDDFACAYLLQMRRAWGQQAFTFGTPSGWSKVQEICVDCGMVEIFLRLAQAASFSRDMDIAGYQALDCIQTCIMPASATQRRKIFDQLMQHSVLEILIDKIENHPLLLHRNAAVNLLRVLSTNLFLGESLPAQKTAEIIEKCCRWVLTGTELFSNELLDSSKAWQIQQMLGRYLPSSAASRYAKRFFALTAEHLMWTAHSFFCRSPEPPRQFVLEIVQSRPEIIDWLLKVASIGRLPWYPESETDSIAMETVAAIMQFPLTMVPSLDVPVEEMIKDKNQADFETSVKILEVFISRPDWAQKLIDIWSIYENETPRDIERLLQRVGTDWYAAIPPQEDVLVQVMEHRGTLRIAILRLIASATYCSTITNGDLLSLLRIAYLGSQKSKSQMEAAMSSDKYDVPLWVERNHEVKRVPMWAAALSNFDEIVSLPREPIIGPIALVRLVTRLAERGLVEPSQSWTELPEGTSGFTSLKYIKQILSPAIVKRILSTAVKRTATFREEGKRRVQQGNYHMAMLAYVPCAELAWNLVQFDRVTEGKFRSDARGAQKELVLSLGNAAEMCKRKNRYEDAFLLAASADRYGRDAPPEEHITSDLVEKNKRRLADAKRALRV